MGRCFMFGNRDVPAGMEEAVYAAVRRAVEMGMDEFIVGRRGSFDSCAKIALSRVKKEFPEIKVYVLLAYHPKGKTELPDGFDGFVYPDGMENVPLRFAIVKANRWAVKNADHVMAYVRYTTGNSAKLLEYAMKKCESVENIAKCM